MSTALQREREDCRFTPERELLDESASWLGMGRSLTFPYPQWRAFDEYRTVYFDEGHGRTLVFVHGLGANATHFEFVAKKLVDRYRVIGLDLVGGGWSLKPKGEYTINLLRDHLLSFLDQRGIKRATLIGHSLGGAVCLSAALRRPSLAEGVALLCSVGVSKVPRWMRVAAPLMLHRALLFPTIALGANFIVRNVFVDRKDENEYVRWFYQSALRDEPLLRNFRDFIRVSKSLCRNVITTNYIEQLSSLHCPVLGIWGDNDKLTSLPSVIRNLGRIPRVRTVVLKHCGHMPMIERPEETTFHLERFLTSPPKRRPYR